MTYGENKKIDESIPSGYTSFSWGYEQAITKARKNSSIKEFFTDGAKNVLEMWIGVLPVVMCMATIALIVSNIVNNRFVAMLAPYIITEFANAILRMSDKKWLRGIAPTKLFNMAQTNTGASFIVYIAVLLILGVVVYFIGGLKHETY